MTTRTAYNPLQERAEFTFTPEAATEVASSFYADGVNALPSGRASVLLRTASGRYVWSSVTSS